MKALQVLFIGLLMLFHPLAGHAFNEECKKIVDAKKYLSKGEFDNKSSAEKTYKFEAIRNDLKDELVSKEKVDPKKVNCLNDLYQQGIKDAASYWADRGQNEECLTNGKIPKTRPSECNEKTWKEFRKSRKYLTALEEEKNKMLRPLAEASDKKVEDCVPKVMTAKSYEELVKVADATRTNMCCGSKDDNQGVVKAVYPEISYQQCLAKISNSNDEMLSIKGLAMCSANIVSSAIKSVWDSLKGSFNFFTSPSQMMGVVSAVKELATNERAQEQFAKKIKESVKEFISTRNATFNNCLNPYEQSMYICEVTGNVIGSMVDFGAILKVVKVLRYGSAAGEVAALLSKTEKGQKALAAMKKAEDFAVSSVGKAKSAVKETADKMVKSVAKDVRAFSLAASLLKKDVSFDEQLNKQIEKAQSHTRVKTNTDVNDPPKLSGSSKPEAASEQIQLQNNGQDININASLDAQRRMDAQAVAANNTRTIVSEVEPPTPPKTPLKLQHNGQDVDINASLNAQRRMDAEPPAPLRLQRQGQEIDINASLNAQRRLDAEVPPPPEPRTVIGDREAPSAPAQAPLRLQHNGRELDINTSLNAQRRADIQEAPSKVPTPVREVTPVQPEPLQLTYTDKTPEPPSAPRAAAPVNNSQTARATGDLSASNSIHRVNQRDGLEPRMNETQRMNQANDLRVTDANRADAVEFRVVKSQKEIDSVLEKLFPDGGGPRSDELRRMLGFDPAKGHVTQAEFNEAMKFVKEIEKKGGQDYLKTLTLTNSEIDTLNYLTSRVPHYAQYADASLQHNLSPLAKRAPADIAPAARPEAPGVKREASTPSPAEESARAKAEKARGEATDRLEVLNSGKKRPNDHQKETLATEFGLNDNLSAAIDWQPVGTRAEIQSIFKKAFSPDPTINVQELRKMTMYNPGKGYLNGADYQAAQRFVKAIEKEGGLEKLNLKNLTKSEKETLNELLKRVPEYLKHQDPSFSTPIKPINVEHPLPSISPLKTDLDKHLPDHSFKISNDVNPSEGGLTKEAVKAAVDFTNGTYAKSAKKLAVELSSMNESQFLKRMEDLAKEGKARKVTVEVRNQQMVRYEFPDGSMVRYMPEGDSIRKGPTYTVEVNKDTLPDTGDPSHTAFKVNQKGEPIPRTPRDIQIPSDIVPGSPEEEKYIRAIMDAGHIRLSR